MLRLFLESGYTLSSLARSQMAILENAFTLYLLHIIKFNDALALCYRALDEDQEHMKTVIKTKLAEMIQNADCNLYYKPALLRLAAGDDSIFVKNSINKASTLRIFEKHSLEIKRCLKKVQFPISIIGPHHIEKLERTYVSRPGEAKSEIEIHALNYVSYKAEYLTKGDAGFSKEDMARDLVILGIRAMRWYYPFLSDLHLTNTIRRTITNRGHGVLTATNVESRRRIIQDEQGNTINLESTVNFKNAEDWAGFAEDPTHSLDAQLTLNTIQSQNNAVGKIARLILIEEQRNQFLAWLQLKYAITEPDLITAIQLTRKSFPYLFSKYLKIDIADAKSAMKKLHRMDIRQSVKEVNRSS